jgi:hypothetical protein
VDERGGKREELADDKMRIRCEGKDERGDAGSNERGRGKESDVPSVMRMQPSG